MLKHVFRVRTHYFCSIFPFFDYKDPWDDFEKYNQARPPPETGWGRIKALFEYTNDGLVSKEYVSVVQITCASFGASFFVGMLLRSVKSYDNFVEANQHTKFVSPYEARRKLQDKVILDGFTSGLKYAMKIGAFSYIFGLTTICVAAYRNKEGILEYIVGVGLAGCISRMYLGWKAALTGLGLGATLGTLLGTFIWAGDKLTGSSSMAEARDWLYKLKLDNEKRKSEVFKQALESSQNPMIKAYMEKVKMEHKPGDEDVVYVVQRDSGSSVNESSTENDVKTNEVNQVSKPIVSN